GPDTLYHWNGSQWLPSSFSTMAWLSTVWGSASNDFWAGGGDTPFSGHTLLHWNGHDWTQQPSLSDRPVKAIWGSARDNVWLVDELGRVFHFDGTNWVSVDLDPVGYLTLVNGDQNEVRIAGQGGQILLHRFR